WRSKRKNIGHARGAVAEYMASARALDSSSWIHPERRIRRAFQIAVAIHGGDLAPLQTLENWILEKVRTLGDTDSTYFASRLMKLLQQLARTEEESREFAAQAVACAV